MHSNNDDWLKILSGLKPPESHKPSTFADLYGSATQRNALGGPNGLSALISAIPSIPYAERPLQWSSGYVKKIEERLMRRAKSLDDKIGALTLGRVMPDLEQVNIGSGKQMYLAVLFLDICQFSSWPSGTHNEQAKVLKVMNIFMAEMLNIIRDFGGTFEKNTGDGLMAYFGSTSAELNSAAKKAAEAACVMEFVNESILTPWFNSNQLWSVKFRVGIDAGQVTLGKVGIPHLAEQFVAIGSSANIACKIMKLLDDGGIVIGNEVRKALTIGWQYRTSMLGSTGFIYSESKEPYPAWELTHRLSKPL